MIDKEKFDQMALRRIAMDGSGVAADLAKIFDLSRQAVGSHLARLERLGLIEADGATRARVWRLKEIDRGVRSFEREGLSEDVVWRSVCAPIVANLPGNVRDIWHYGITEMVNNAIDHSGSKVVDVGIARNAVYTQGWVVDHGEGIFLKIQRALGLFDPRESILELAKGKFTTDPANHTGEGIFFSSKLFDKFDIRSGNLHFMHDGDFEDVLYEWPKDAPGTFVLMDLANDSSRTEQEVYERFAPADEFTFAKTIVPVKLAQYEGEKLVSRSQAKRLTMRFERFRTVILDFDGVAEIGQAFADEVFRVFQAAHPGTELIPVSMTDPVDRMIRRVTAAEKAGAPND